MGTAASDTRVLTNARPRAYRGSMDNADRIARLEQLVIAALQHASRKKTLAARGLSGLVEEVRGDDHCGGCGQRCGNSHNAGCWVPLLDAYRREVAT